MDPIDFIDSKDIRNYLRKIDYAPQIVEASYLIWQSSIKTIKEKHDAWKWIIENESDVPIPKRNWIKGWDSLHKMLSDYMEIEDNIIKRLMASDPDCAYYAEGRGIGYKTGIEQDYDLCLTEAKRRAEVDRSLFPQKCPEKKDFYIYKIPIRNCVDDDGEIPYVFGRFNTYGQLLSVCVIDEESMERELASSDIDFDVWRGSFDGMWFDVPIPFEKGDVVKSAITSEEIVFEGTVGEAFKERGCFDKYNGDDADMMASGLDARGLFSMVDGDGRFGYEHLRHLELEYASINEEGENKVLFAYGAYLKGEISLYEFLVCAQAYRRQRELAGISEILSYVEKRFSRFES